MNQLVNEPAKSITIIIRSFLAFEFYGIHNFSLKGKGGCSNTWMVQIFRLITVSINRSVNQFINPLTSWLVESLILSPWISWVNEAVKSIILFLPPLPPLPSPSLSSSSSISFSPFSSLLLFFILPHTPLLQGMDTLAKLRDLNLGGNQITTVGTSLERFTDLETLNLSGNKIALFKVGIRVL